MRVSLVRALYLAKVIVINTNLNSLDEAMKQLVKGNLLRLVEGKYAKEVGQGWTVFVRENQDISHHQLRIEHCKGEHQSQHRVTTHSTKFLDSHNFHQLEEIKPCSAILTYLQHESLQLQHKT